MFQSFLRTKIHRARVTSARLDYEGSISIGPEFLKKTGLLPYEKVDVYNITNGERFSTYVIEGSEAREMAVNGAAARLVAVGDLLIVCAFASVDLSKEKPPVPTLALVEDNDNRFTIKT